jgi:hypothetical protein
MDQVAKSEVGPPRGPIRAVVVLLGLLSVVLLARLLGFAVKFKTDVRKNVKRFLNCFWTEGFCCHSTISSAYILLITVFALNFPFTMYQTFNNISLQTNCLLNPQIILSNIEY